MLSEVYEIYISGHAFVSKHTAHKTCVSESIGAELHHAYTSLGSRGGRGWGGGGIPVHETPLGFNRFCHGLKPVFIELIKL